MVEKSSTPGEQKVEKDLRYKELKSASFRKSEKLLLKTDFSAVFRAPTGRFSVDSLRILYRENELELSRIGIVVPKKIVRLATARNRHKRLIRERFRQVKGCLPNVDIVVLVKGNMDEKGLMQCCDRVWKFLTFENDD